MDAKLLQPLKFILKVLKNLGLRQDWSKSWKNYILGHLIHLVIIDYTFLAFFINLFMTETLYGKSEIFLRFYAISSASATLIRMYYYIINFGRLDKMVANLEEIIKFTQDERFKKRSIVDEQVRFVMKIFKIFTIFLIVIITESVIIEYESENVLYPIWYPFDTKSCIGYYIAELHQTLFLYYAETLEILSDFLPLIFMSYLVGLLNELAQRLDSVGLSEQFGKEELVTCIKTHQMIKEIAANFEEILSIIFTIQVSLFITDIYLTVFMIYTTNQVVIFQSIPIVLKIFLICYFCQELKDASENISYAVFHSKWYRLDKPTRKTVLAFMENLKSPIKIRCLKLFELNLKTFGNFIKAAYLMDIAQTILWRF